MLPKQWLPETKRLHCLFAEQVCGPTSRTITLQSSWTAAILVLKSCRSIVKTTHLNIYWIWTCIYLEYDRGKVASFRRSLDVMKSGSCCKIVRNRGPSLDVAFYQNWMTFSILLSREEQRTALMVLLNWWYGFLYPLDHFCQKLPGSAGSEVF